MLMKLMLTERILDWQTAYLFNIVIVYRFNNTILGSVSWCRKSKSGYILLVNWRKVHQIKKVIFTLAVTLRENLKHSIVCFMNKMKHKVNKIWHGIKAWNVLPSNPIHVFLRTLWFSCFNFFLFFEWRETLIK